MARSKSRVNEEKLLNEMFILLEYSDSFYDFIMGLSPEAYKEVKNQIKLREIKEDDKGILGV